MLDALKRYRRYGLDRSPNENIAWLRLKLNPSLRAHMLVLPTIEDWWRITRSYPSFRNPTPTALKDFGYLTILNYLDTNHPQRILEFGHGLGHRKAELLYSRTDVEVWACDDFHSIYYYPTEREEWEQQYTKFISPYSKTHFVKCLVGDPEQTRTLLPEGSFDMVCSVSVLEELEPEPLTNVLKHCRSLLTPGGRLLASFDLHVRDYAAIVKLIRAVRSTGFAWSVEPSLLRWANWETALLEPQTSVMLYYEAHFGETRHYGGNWTTLILDVANTGAN